MSVTSNLLNSKNADVDCSSANRKVRCPVCNDCGLPPQGHDVCPKCEGKGYVWIYDPYYGGNDREA